MKMTRHQFLQWWQHPIFSALISMSIMTEMFVMNECRWEELFHEERNILMKLVSAELMNI
jgi:hypothetical protein